MPAVGTGWAPSLSPCRCRTGFPSCCPRHWRSPLCCFSVSVVTPAFAMRRVLGLAVPGYRMLPFPSGDVNNHKQAMTELLSGCDFFSCSISETGMIRYIGRQSVRSQKSALYARGHHRPKSIRRDQTCFLATATTKADLGSTGTNGTLGCKEND